VFISWRYLFEEGDLAASFDDLDDALIQCSSASSRCDDPYAFAYDANCSRLDYSPSLKASIKAEVLAASGELARIAAETKAKADSVRAEKAKGNDHAAKARQPKNGAPPREGAPNPKPARKHKSHAAQAVAAAAGVSPSTAERALVAKSNPPAVEDKSDVKLVMWTRRGRGMKRVPHHPKALAAFLVKTWPKGHLEWLSCCSLGRSRCFATWSGGGGSASS
jgi:hypothetical protein